MSYFGVIDIETTWMNQVMSIGLVIADQKSKMPICGKCYIIDPTYKDGGMYSYALMAHGKKNTVLDIRERCLADADRLLRQYGVERILAYNALFDKSHLPELGGYVWCDIMKIAAYRQYNRNISPHVECYSTGRMKRGYGVESILRMIGPDPNYQETHNAYLDAIDELSIVRMLDLDLSIYDNAII